VDYYEEKGQMYFSEFLKPLSDVDNLAASDFIDWGNNEKYEQAIGVGECAGVIIDLIATLLFDSQEKVETAKLNLEEEKYAASIYHSYPSMINTAKALLTAENAKVNTHIGIINDFDEFFVATGKLKLENAFQELVMQLNKQEPTASFASSYLRDAERSEE